MKKKYFSALSILALSISLTCFAGDINQLCEIYSLSTLSKLVDTSANVNKTLIANGSYGKSSDVIPADFKKAYDQIKQSINAEIQSNKDLSESEKIELSKYVSQIISDKYAELERNYNGTVEMRNEFCMTLDNDLNALRASGEDMTKLNNNILTCTTPVIDSISSYSKAIIKQNASVRDDSTLLDLIDKIGADTEKMKLDAKSNFESNCDSYSPAFKKLVKLYDNQIIDNFKAFSILVLRDRVVKNNALKDKDSSLSILDLMQKYKFSTEFAGVYLGDSKDDVLKTFKDSKLISQKASDKNTWADTYVYEGNPVFKQAASTTMYFTQNILVKIEIALIPAANTSLSTLYKSTRADFEAKFGIFASIYNSDLDPAEIEKFRTLSSSEKTEKYTPAECVKYIWGGELDTAKLINNNRGNMIIKIKENTDGKLLITAEHETLYNKAMDRFNPQRAKASPVDI